MSGAIDKLEVQAPRRDCWTDYVLRACERPDRANDALLRKQGGQYRRAIDLRRDGLSSVLYLNSWATGGDKLVLYRVGDMSFAHVMSQIASAFCGDIQNLRIMRIDMAVDLVGYTVGFFRTHCYVTRKRCYREIGTRFEANSGEVETMIFGKRPNVIRIYDKAAQQKAEARSCRRPVTAKEGQPHSALAPLTRVERQYGGGQIPAQLASIGSVRDCALTINPFECLGFSGAVDLTAQLEGLTARRYVRILGLRTMIQTLGCQQALSELNRRSHGEGRKLLRELERFLAKDQPKALPDLCAMYRKSLRNQLGSGGVTACH